MFNAMKYIKALEAVGIKREQAEAHVQLVFEAMEGELVTKSEFNSFRDHVDNRFLEIEKKLVELEFRITTRMGLFIMSSTTITIAVLGWLK